MPLARHPALLAMLLAATACEDPPPPWAGRPDGRLRDESEPFLPAPTSSPLGISSAPGAEGGAPDVAEPLPEEALLAPRSGRHGGLWLSCHDRFVASGEPRRDATRLALSCGPINGMRRHGGLVTGTVTADRAALHPFSVAPGDCLRVFAAGEASLTDLDLRITTPAGRLIGEDETEASWAIVEPQRPVCHPSGGPLVLRVSASEGGGAFAAEIWTMPARGADR